MLERQGMQQLCTELVTKRSCDGKQLHLGGKSGKPVVCGHTNVGHTSQILMRHGHRRRRSQTSAEIADFRVASANVCTLHPAEGSDSFEIGEGLASTGRTAIFERAFSDADYCLVGIQEARVQGNIDRVSSEYRMLGSSATPNGTHGVQLWIRSTVNAIVKACVPLSPRLFFAVLQIHGIDFVICVGHSPINGKDLEVAVFWKTLIHEFTKLRSVLTHACGILLVDANARCGSVASPFIGNVGVEVENTNGEWFRYGLEELSLHALNTYYDAGTTWTGSRGHTSRIDYIGVDSHLFSCCTGCSVNKDIDLSTAERDDHNLVDAIFHRIRGADDESRQSRPKTVQKRPRKLCAAKLQCPFLIQRFQHHMSEFHDMNTSWSIDLHLDKFLEHTRYALEWFVDGSRRARKSWLSEPTWTLVQQANAVKKSLRKIVNFGRSLTAAQTFLAWASLRPHSFVRYHSYGDILQCEWNLVFYHRWYAIMSRCFNQMRNRVRAACRADRKKHLDSVICSANTAASHGDIRSVFKLAENLVQYTPSIVKAVQRSDGTMTSTRAEYDDRWTEYFQTVFGAKKLDSLSELMCEQSQSRISSPTFEGWRMKAGWAWERELCDCYHSTSTSTSPSLHRTFSALQHLKTGKAIGTDGLPSELIRVGGYAFACKFHNLLKRVWAQTYIPLRWRGGRIVELLKKGVSSVCENHRGVLISDHLSKAATDILDEDVAPAYDTYVSKEQCGATANRALIWHHM